MAQRYREFDWYEAPLYYDIVFDTETAAECDFLEAVIARHGSEPGRGRARAGRRRVLEPACGSGRLVLEMARRGHDVIGFDRSPGALEFARRRLRARPSLPGRAGVVRGLMQSFQVRGRFDVAHCLVSSFRYLLSPDDARSHLECVARALRPGGLYVLGLHLTEYDDHAVSRERWVAERAGVRVVCNIQSWPAHRRTRRERTRSRLVVSRRGAVTRYETSWHFRSYSTRQLRALLARVPAVEHVATYDFDYDLARPQALGERRLDQVLILRRV